MRALKSYKYKVKAGSNWIIAEGATPVGLVAHIDTVFQEPPVLICHDKELGLLWSPHGSGFDDRAGVEAILSILDRGFRPSVIFTSGEESGGVGAWDLIEKYKKAPFKMKLLIELDRQGEKDCVFYDQDNKELIKYIESFGFKKAEGTFTDISILSPAWDVGSVNLSVGYYMEHSYSEHLYIDVLNSTIDKVSNILGNAIKMPSFRYILRKEEQTSIFDFLKNL